MNTVRPNWPAIIKARSNFDVQINKVMAFVAPAPGRDTEALAPAAFEFISARLRVARRELDLMEDALKGGA